jgi:endo-1,4-beta-D-glucanase Y
MPRRLLLPVLLALLAPALPTESVAQGAFATGEYRNLFRETGHSDAEIRAKINAGFEQLFHGDSATQAVFYWSGQNQDGRLAYLSDINNNDVRSEGMSYGMMIAVQMDRKAEFDALWNWSRTYMYHADPKHPAYGFFSWSMNVDGTPRSESPAPDGEEYYVMALYFASARWGDGNGIYDYRAMADRLLSDMKNRGVITGPWVSRPDHVETDGAEFNLEHRMVRFTPDMRREDHTDPSYHLPAFYELWARWGPEADRAFWADAARVSRDFLERTTHPVTALAPEYANFDGTPVTASFNQRSGTFGPDAWRTAANWSIDWSWWNADPRARARSDRIQAFFESKGIESYGNRYTLDGSQQLDTSHSTALVATNAVASLAATNPRAARFVEEFWKTEVPSGRFRYYDGMWYLMGLLHCSGQFRIWTPKWATSSPVAAASAPRPTPPTRDPHTPGYVTATELPDGAVPPAGADGNFIIGPTHSPAPEMTVRDDVPHGTVHEFTMTSAESRIYPGIVREPGTFGTVDPSDPTRLVVTTSHPAPWTRRIAVYVPAGYVPGTEVPFLVGADGPDRMLFPALDNLIAQKRVPAMVAISVGNGGGDAQGSQRGLEYDTMSGLYAEFIEKEVLPLVERKYGVRLTHDPEGRATMGGSSGGSAAFIMAWYHPELYHRVLAYSITAINQQWPHSDETPHGAWELHERLIPNSPVKPIRVWLEVGDRDLYNPNVMRDGMHDWVLASEKMADALASKGYHYQFVFARNAGHVDRAAKLQTLPGALEWLWRGYPIGS